MGINTRRSNRHTNYAAFDDDEEDDDFVIDETKPTEDKNSIDGFEEEPSEEFEEDVHEDVNQQYTEETTPHQDDGHKEEEADEYDEDDIKPRTRHKRVNYNEDEIYAEIDEIDEVPDVDSRNNHHRDNNHDNEDNDDEYDEFKPSKRRRRTPARHASEDDDEFHDSAPEDAYDEDDLEFGSLNKRTRRSGFIVNDEDEDNDYAYGSKRRSHNSRNHISNDRNARLNRRSRLRELQNGSENPNSLTLEDEIRELQNDSPLNSPKRNLRDRRHVNYTLPPPELNEAQLEELQDGGDHYLSHASPRRGRNGGRFGGANSQVTSVRRLFPTVGPFGGGDVHSLFQSDVVPSGLAALANAESSDSEEENDLIKPTDPNDVSNIITAANDSMLQGGVQKKKNTLADTDPLAIDTNIDFSVIGGLNNYINQLKEMITLPLLYPEVYSKFHITPPRGVLFHGPPGTGKTLMARALAASCSSQNKKITFFMRKGADCLSKWVGEAERHLRLLFEEAKQHQPSIIFFDEIDGLAPVRSSKQEQIHASIVSTLLALMDGMDNRGQVIIIGATNRPDSIDPALRRPGRFDREFYFPLPDLQAREDILKIQMRKWDNQLDDRFIKELAVLTKGYGGADLRALCTESALNSIQRTYPQIYKTNDKLKIDISKIKANSSDFTRALKKIVPNSARSTNSVSEPLPEFVKPLLDNQFDDILAQLNKVLPMEKEPSLLEEAEYESLNNDFQTQQVVKTFDTMRVYKPRLAVCGSKLQGLKYLSNAVLNKLEGFTIQVLDLGKIFSDSSISIENLCIQLFSELKRHKPSILFIPDTVGFLSTISESLRSTIRYLVRSINSNDKILIYCEIEGELNDEISEELEELFDINEDNCIIIRDANESEREKFFGLLWDSIKITPNEYNDLQIRPKKTMKQLEVVAIQPTEEELKSSQTKLAKSEKEQAKTDMRLKNTLKVRLSGLLDLFKARYKRFKKPIIDDVYLAHLFDETPDPQSIYQIKDGKILEVTSGKLFNNIDLDVIEERLWNGFYNEPREFLRDLEMILKDANTSGERDRILKANEMYAHAVVGIEEIEVQFPMLITQWREVSAREKRRKHEYVRLQKEVAVNPATVPGAAPTISAELQAPQGTDVNTADENIELEEEITVLKSTREDEIHGEGVKNTELVTNVNSVINNDDDERQTQAQSQIQPGQTVNFETELPVIPIVPAQPDLQGEQSIGLFANVDAHKGADDATLGDENKTMHIKSETQVDDADIEISNKQESVDEKVEEVEEVEFVPEAQTVKFDTARVESLKKLLLNKTTGFKLTKLERINSKFCDIVWKHRLAIEKNSLLDDLESFINNLK